MAEDFKDKIDSIMKEISELLNPKNISDKICKQLICLYQTIGKAAEPNIKQEITNIFGQGPFISDDNIKHISNFRIISENPYNKKYLIRYLMGITPPPRIKEYFDCLGKIMKVRDRQPEVKAFGLANFPEEEKILDLWKNTLKNTPLEKKMLEDSKIKKALNYLENRENIIKEKTDISIECKNQIDDALFEILFAAKISPLAKAIEYEVEQIKSGQKKDKNSSIDFKIEDNSENTYFLELTRINESNYIKSNTLIESSRIFSLIDDRYEIGKADQVILGKVSKINEKTGEITPIKFQKEKIENSYNILIVDASALNKSTFDQQDFDEILNGMFHNEENKTPGLFDNNHPNPRSIYFSERIHVVCFMRYDNWVELSKEVENNQDCDESWRNFGEQLINNKGKWKFYDYYNPSFFANGEKLPILKDIENSFNSLLEIKTQ